MTIQLSVFLICKLFWMIYSTFIKTRQQTLYGRRHSLTLLTSLEGVSLIVFTTATFTRLALILSLLQDSLSSWTLTISFFPCLSIFWVSLYLLGHTWIKLRHIRPMDKFIILLRHMLSWWDLYWISNLLKQGQSKLTPKGIFVSY